MFSVLSSAPISHDRAKKGNAMLIVLSLAAAYAGVVAVRAAWNSLRDLPHSNEDFVHY